MHIPSFCLYRYSAMYSRGYSLLLLTLLVITSSSAFQNYPRNPRATEGTSKIKKTPDVFSDLNNKESDFVHLDESVALTDNSEEDEEEDEEDEVLEEMETAGSAENVDHDLFDNAFNPAQ